MHATTSTTRWPTPGCRSRAAARSAGRSAVPATPPRALPSWLPQLFRPAQQQQQLREADELLRVLLESQQQPSGTKAVARQEADALVDALLSAAEGLPFNERLLGGGPWRVLYTRGSPQLWKATFEAGKLVNASNAASQDLNPDDRSVLNRAEYLGDKLWVTAAGTYQPMDDSTQLPKRIQANITSGAVHVFGLTLQLPIRGTGYFEIRYLCPKLRVFQSGNAIAVQVKE